MFKCKCKTLPNIIHLTATSFQSNFSYPYVGSLAIKTHNLSVVETLFYQFSYRNTLILIVVSFSSATGTLLF